MEWTENVVHRCFGKICLAIAHGYQNSEYFLTENCVQICLIYAVTLDIRGTKATFHHLLFWPNRVSDLIAESMHVWINSLLPVGNMGIFFVLFFSFCWQLFASLPRANVKILFYSVSLPFWWWLLWRNLQARDALFFLLLIRAALKYLAYLIGYVFFQMETPYFLGKHWLACR